MTVTAVSYCLSLARAVQHAVPRLNQAAADVLWAPEGAFSWPPPCKGMPDDAATGNFSRRAAPSRTLTQLSAPGSSLCSSKLAMPTAAACQRALPPPDATTSRREGSGCCQAQFSLAWSRGWHAQHGATYMRRSVLQVLRSVNADSAAARSIGGFWTIRDGRRDCNDSPPPVPPVPCSVCYVQSVGQVLTMIKANLYSYAAAWAVQHGQKRKGNE